MIQILIVADDFTGALDAGAQFAARGYRVAITTQYPPDFSGVASNVEILVADAQSRHLPQGEAYARTYSWFQFGKAQDIQILYKKTDSTLRGNIGVELRASLSGSGRRAAVFTPAFPRLQRTVVGGEVFVGGRRLCDTEFAKDPFTPVTGCSVSAVIQADTHSLPVTVTAPASLSALLHATSERQIFAVDAQTEAELSQIIAAVHDFISEVVLAGSAGLAQVMPLLLPPAAPPLFSGSAPSSCLIVCGSVNPIALNQLHYAEALGIASIHLTPRQYLLDDYWRSTEGKQFFKLLVRKMRSKRCLALKTADNRADLSLARSFALQNSIDPQGLHLLVAERLGALSARIVAEAAPDLLVVFGGDTLYSVVRSLDAKSITPEREILPGVIQSRLNIGQKQIRLISKAGGFGNPSLIEALLRHYRLIPDLLQFT